MKKDYEEIYRKQQTKKKAFIYDEVETIVNKETGEVSSKNRKHLTKRTQTPDFIMLFTKTAPMLANAKLTSAQSTVLFNIITGNFILRDNFLDLSSITRSELVKKTNLKKNTISHAISTLTKKEIFLRKKIGNSHRYFLNPFIFGKGNFQDIESLRYEVSLDYNFKSLELKEGSKTSIKYEDLNEILESPNDFQIVDATQTTTDDGTVEQVIEIEEIHQNETSNQEESNLPLMDIDKEILLLKEQNKAKELSIEEMKLKIKIQEMGIN